MIDAPDISTLRVGRASTDEGGSRSVEWRSRPNVSLTPRQMTLACALAASGSLAVAVFFCFNGVPFILPFAGLEIVGIAAALWVHARHVGDNERIALAAGRLVVDRQVAGAHEHLEFEPNSVRIEAPDRAHALVKVSGRLSGRGFETKVGRHLRPPLRPLLARELRWALVHVR